MRNLFLVVLLVTFSAQHAVCDVFIDYTYTGTGTFEGGLSGFPDRPAGSEITGTIDTTVGDGGLLTPVSITFIDGKYSTIAYENIESSTGGFLIDGVFSGSVDALVVAANDQGFPGFGGVGVPDKNASYELDLGGDSGTSQELIPYGSTPIVIATSGPVTYSLESSQAVPEPSTWVLLSGGLCVLVVFYCRRKMA